MTDSLASVLIMANETPKKIVNESLNCFTCSSLCSVGERIFIFGKSSHNFAEIIKSALNIDINCYSYDTKNNLFVCKTTGSPSSLYEPHKQHNMASNYKGLYGIFYKISLKVVKSENSQ